MANQRIKNENPERKNDNPETASRGKPRIKRDESDTDLDHEQRL